MFLQSGVIWTCFFLLFLRLWVFPNTYTEPPDLLHSGCVQWASTFRLDALFSSLICGSSLPPHNRHLFLNLGIYHWFIASGSHLILLMQLLKKIKITRLKFLLPLLFLYAVTTSWQAPIVRALLLLLVSSLSDYHELQLTPQQKNLCSALLCLTINPQWFSSLSLPLSWLCAMACDRPSILWKESLKISLFLLPLFQKWSFLHVLYNTLLTPLFSLLLFPLSVIFFLITPVIPQSGPWGNTMWDMVLRFLQTLPGDSNTLLISHSLEMVWLYTFLLQFLLLIYERTARD